MSDKIPILIIGLGNEYRKDDGLALSIVSRFNKSHSTKIKVIDSISDGTALMEEWSKGKIVFVIDAVDSGGKPGSIYRFDVKTDIIPKDYFSSYSTHSFNIIEAIELGKVLDNIPPHLILYGIEGEDFSYGVGFSKHIEEAVNEVVNRINSEIKDMAKIKCKDK